MFRQQAAEFLDDRSNVVGTFLPVPARHQLQEPSSYTPLSYSPLNLTSDSSQSSDEALNANHAEVLCKSQTEHLKFSEILFEYGLIGSKVDGDLKRIVRPNQHKELLKIFDCD